VCKVKLDAKNKVDKTNERRRNGKVKKSERWGSEWIRGREVLRAHTGPILNIT